MLVLVLGLNAGLPDQLSGVYKTRFQNELVDGTSFTSENILEITSYKPGLAYFRGHFEFYNRHECNISGIAQAQGDRLVYHGPKDDLTDGSCILTIQRLRDGIHVFQDKNGACKAQTCGVRGGYSHDVSQPADFAIGSRKPIHYLSRLRASSQYQDAVEEYDAAKH